MSFVGARLGLDYSLNKREASDSNWSVGGGGKHDSNWSVAQTHKQAYMYIYTDTRNIYIDVYIWVV